MAVDLIFWLSAAIGALLQLDRRADLDDRMVRFSFSLANVVIAAALATVDGDDAAGAMSWHALLGTAFGAITTIWAIWLLDRWQHR